MDNHLVGPSEHSRRLRPVKSLVRALDLLDTLVKAGQPLGVTDLAAAAGFSKTATYNLVTTLETRGLIRRDGGNRYGLGWRLLELGEFARTHSSLGEMARPHLEALAELAGETAFAAVLDGDSILCLDMVESRRSVPLDWAPGRRALLRENAAGELLLAFAAPRRRRRYAQSRPEGAAAALQRLDGIRESGVAVPPDEPGSMWASIAAPIRDPARDVIGAIGLVGPKSRFTVARTRELTHALWAESEAMAIALARPFQEIDGLQERR
jgi:IclR family acetate operon transcriptional repressor